MIRTRALTALGSGAIALVSYAASAAASEQKPREFTFSGSATVTSDYVSRGFTQTWNDPALQVGFTATHKSGWFTGVWASTVSPKAFQDAHSEWDLYVGYGGKIGDVGYSLTALYYIYPGAEIRAADTKYDYGELVPKLTWKFLTLKYWWTFTEEYFASNDKTFGTTAITGPKGSFGSGYIDVNANFDIGWGLNLLLHYGHQTIVNFEQGNAQDIKIALTKSFEGDFKDWSVTGAYTQGFDKNDFYRPSVSRTGNGDTKDRTDPTFIVSVTRTF
jgi:uncharacterized protein (TIGR02001 family)